MAGAREAEAGARVARTAVGKLEKRGETQPHESSEITSRTQAGSRESESESERASSPRSRARQPPDWPRAPPEHRLVLSAQADP